MPLIQTNKQLLEQEPGLIQGLASFFPGLIKLDPVPKSIENNFPDYYGDRVWYSFDDPKYHSQDIAELIIGMSDRHDRIVFVTYHIYLNFIPS